MGALKIITLILFYLIFFALLLQANEKSEGRELLDGIIKNKQVHNRSLTIYKNVKFARVLAKSQKDKAIEHLKATIQNLEPKHDGHFIILCLQTWWMINQQSAFEESLKYIGHNNVVIRGGIQKLFHDCSEEQNTYLLKKVAQSNEQQLAHLIHILSDIYPQKMFAVITSALKSKNIQLRYAALFAAKKSGSKKFNTALFKNIIHKDQDIRTLSHEILQDQVNPNLTKLISTLYYKIENPHSKILSLDLLARSKNNKLSNLVLEASNDGNEDVAKAAITALAHLGNEKSIHPLILRIMRDPPSSVRRALQKALVAACQSAKVNGDWQKHILENLDKAEKKPRKALFEVMTKVGGEVFLNTLYDYTAKQDSKHAKEALRALAASPDAEALPLLEKIVTSKLNENTRIIAIRGMTSLIQQLPLSAKDKVNKLKSILKHSPREIEKELIQAAIKRHSK